MVRAALVALVLLLAVPAGAGARGERRPRAAPAPASAVFVVSGRGWGHGVGMSQYGALGAALRGWSYARILAHYYRGTELGRVGPTLVRVLVADGRTSLKVASTAPFTVRDGSGALHELEAGTYALGRGLTLPVEGERRALRGPLVVARGRATLSLNGRTYRGSLRISVVRGRLRAINAVGLEGYLAGVVPQEVPSRWPAEALKAQAVVARSYALAVRKTGPFDLYADVRSQVYGGVAAEEPETTAAVRATAGEVVLYAGRIATTYFFSTSGGRTAAVADVWSGGVPTPYLVSVPDPYDSLSPYHTWGPLAVGSERLAAALGTPGPLLDVRTTLNRSRRVSKVVGVVPSGEVSVSGASLRTALGLRSTWFRIGVLSLAPPRARRVVFGSRLQLRGIARGVRAVALEGRVSGGSWRRTAALVTAADGRFAVTVKPTARTEYRLAAAGARTPPVRVLVAPSLRLLLPRQPTALAGTVRPVLAGAAVVVERRTPVGWAAAARATVDARGRFEASVALTPGTYRARLAPVRGFAAAVSPPLRVVAP